MTDIEVTEAKVTYTTKELLKRIDDRFERLEQLASEATTRHEFFALESRVATLEEGRAVMHAVGAEKAALFSRTDKLLGFIIGVGLLALNIYSVTH